MVLGLVAIAQLMVVLDSTIVNIALPSAQRALGIPDSDRQWVVTAYALAFGSLVLVGGRLAHQHQSRHESVRAHVRSGTTRAYPASDDADFLTGTAFPVHGGTTAAFTVPDRPKRMVETRPL